MDFNSAIRTLQFYLDNQSFLQKISSIEDLKHFSSPAISLLITQKGTVFHLPEDKLFKKGIFLFDDDCLDPKIISKDRNIGSNIIKSSIDLFENIVNDKMIKSGYWALFTRLDEIKLDDNIIILKKNNDLATVYDLIVLRGPMNKKIVDFPNFLNSTNIIAEYTYLTTPHSRPPKIDHFLSYRKLKDSTKINWSIKQISAYLGMIWNERSLPNVYPRLKLLFESVVLLTEKVEVFNKTLQMDKDTKSMVAIPSNFTIGIVGGYARGEYSKTSDLDMLLIHEGNEKQFFQVGEALDQVLQYVPNLELCKLENLKNLNFHENSISSLLLALLEGDATYLNKNQRKELDKMLGSIEQLRQVPLSSEEQKDGIRKYCWSIYKSIINMVPIYEKPIGKGDFLRTSINQSAKKSLHKLIPILLRITDAINEDYILGEYSLGEYLRVCQPYIWDSIFKKYSVLTALQDIGTIFAVLSDTTFTSPTIDRFKVAMEKNIISKDQCNKFIKGYNIFSQIKYKLTDELPIEALELINDEMRTLIKEVYWYIHQNLEPEELDEIRKPVAYPLLVISDIHWGLNNSLAKKCLREINKICLNNQIRSIIIAGDVLNIDRANELTVSDPEGIYLLNELSEIQNSIGNQRIHIISGNHDQESFYRKYCEKMRRELDIHFLGNHYSDEKIWIEHGDLDFWLNFTPPLDRYISEFREKNKLCDQKIIVGHNHQVYEEKKHGFYANGTIGKSFSSTLVTDESIELLKVPVEYSFDFNKLWAEYSGIRNAEFFINDYVQGNFKLIEWDQFTTALEVDNSSQKNTWIVTEKGIPTGIIPFNRVQDIVYLENIQVYEIAFPISYTFKLGQTLKEVWKVFSITGDSILPVTNQEEQIVGTLSIFSIPKPEKVHTETKEATIDAKMENIGNFLTQKFFEKQKKMK
ncbi:MAG: metallophosphoesterase [Candidatus Hodarchaeota archaeon]